MKFLEAKRLAEAKRRMENTMENKMQEGNRIDQRADTVKPFGVVKDVPSKIHPRAKELAKELGVDVKTVVGTGPDGQVLVRDVRAAAEGNS